MAKLHALTQTLLKQHASAVNQSKEQIQPFMLAEQLLLELSQPTSLAQRLAAEETTK